MTKDITSQSAQQWIQKALYWADHNYGYIAYHQNNGKSYPHKGFRHLLAVGRQPIPIDPINPFLSLERHASQWLFGYLGYDLKNHIEALSSHNEDRLQFPDIYFFQPEYLFELRENEIQLIIGREQVFDEIDCFEPEPLESDFGVFQADFNKEGYVEKVNTLIDHIIEGDCYEINFCQAFHGDFKQIDPVGCYLHLNEISPKPFSCFQKFAHHYILCASPERFLKKKGDQLISQPIKGTRPRFQDPMMDEQMVQELKTDHKERAENLMIVDLVRNDLAKSSLSGSVQVEELFGIYSFEQVHQMISTVSASLSDRCTGIQALKNAFPMGSMTGAPKIKVMELIETYETSKRGAFSGAAGYIDPFGDFDFNVLIRSLFINAATKNYGFHVGSAITYDAIPEKEYEECLLKAKAILQLIKS
jgi:para-aminobenzoate synthetase component 1